MTESRLFQTLHKSDFEARANLVTAATPTGLPDPEVAEGTAVGRIEIPRLGLSTIIAEGETESTLRVAVGHIPRTAFPGRIGNIGLAGHRDTFFRALHRIRLSDEIRLTARGGSGSLYRVSSISIVEPSDLGVLTPGAGSSVTLVTCYPFHFLGAAPKRFVVRAERVPS